jgi:acyl-CoA thioester hydrolase
MSRIKIERYASYPFKTELDVRVSDLNYGAHLGYDSLLGLAHQARIRLFEELGVNELDLGDGKTGLIVVDIGVNYRGEAFLGDVLVFETCAAEIKHGSFRLAHRVTKRQGADVALIELGCVAFDYGARRPSRLPDAFRDKLAMYAPMS